MKRIIEIPDKLYSDIMTIGISMGKIDYLLTAIKESEEFASENNKLRKGSYDEGYDDGYKAGMQDKEPCKYQSRCGFNNATEEEFREKIERLLE